MGLLSGEYKAVAQGTSTVTITGMAGNTEWEVFACSGKGRDLNFSECGDSALKIAEYPSLVYTLPMDPPAAPTLTPGNGQLSASWTAPTADGGAITGYDVRYRAGATGGWATHDHTGTGTSATITGLNNGTSYQTQVRATNAAGQSRWSSSGTGTPTVTARDASVALSWTSGGDGRSAITRWQYASDADSYASWTDVPGSSAGTASHTVTNLTNGTAYKFKVRAVNAIGNGAASPARHRRSRTR